MQGLQKTVRLSFLLLLAPVTLACQGQGDVRANTFDAVWETVNEGFYDPTFGGRDWREIGDGYRQSALSAETDSAFFVSVNQMLFELGVSHLGVIPRDHPEWIGAPSVFSDGSIGIDARILRGRIVIARVEPGSPAAIAGLQSGLTVLTVNGRDVADLTEEALTPPTTPLNAALPVTQKVVEQFHGPAGSRVSLAITGDGGDTSTVEIEMVERTGRVVLLEGVPPAFLEFETRMRWCTPWQRRF